MLLQYIWKKFGKGELGNDALRGHDGIPQV
jgi:hypothetical protein